MPIISGSESASGSSSQSDGKESKPKATKRLLSNWLRSYGEYSEESESPEDYHLWVGLSVLASAVRRNIWLNQGIYILYPNLYVILVGPPGIGKSTPIRMGRKLLIEVEGITFGPDSVTREELIRIMSKSGKNVSQSAMVLHSTELSSLIDPSGIRMIQFLTEIFDGDFKFGHGTRHSGSYTIHNPILNLLAGTTPSWIAEGLPSTVVTHGFSSRTVFVYGDKPRYLKPFPSEPDKELMRSLINDLNYISTLEGEFSWGEGSKEMYEELYAQIANSTPKDFRIEGFHARKKVHVLKLAMLLSIAEDDSFEILPSHIETAWRILNSVQTRMHKTFSAMGKYDHASDLERMEARIVAERGMTSEQIYQEFYASGDVQDIARMLQMLISMGRIEREKHSDGTSVYKPILKNREE